MEVGVIPDADSLPLIPVLTENGEILLAIDNLDIPIIMMDIPTHTSQDPVDAADGAQRWLAFAFVGTEYGRGGWRDEGIGGEMIEVMW